MTEVNQIAAELADGVWHSERSLYNALGCPAWFHGTLRKMRTAGFIERMYDPYGQTYWRLA